MAAATGTGTLNFGAAPGTSAASLAVVGQTLISATSNVEAFLMAEASADHTAEDATYAAIWIALTCGVPTAGVGFTIYARSEYPFTGTFLVRWVWAD